MRFLPSNFRKMIGFWFWAKNRDKWYSFRDKAMNRFFWGFWINWFVIGPLHYLSSRSDFGVEVAEIFVYKIWISYLLSRGVGYWMFKRKLPDLLSQRIAISLTRWVRESLTPELVESGSCWLPDLLSGELSTSLLYESGSLCSDKNSRIGNKNYIRS